MGRSSSITSDQWVWKWWGWIVVGVVLISKSTLYLVYDCILILWEKAGNFICEALFWSIILVIYLCTCTCPWQIMTHLPLTCSESFFQIMVSQWKFMSLGEEEIAYLHVCSRRWLCVWGWGGGGWVGIGEWSSLALWIKPGTVVLFPLNNEGWWM